jgi:hypothetical protein
MALAHKFTIQAAQCRINVILHIAERLLFMTARFSTLKDEVIFPAKAAGKKGNRN